MSSFGNSFRRPLRTLHRWIGLTAGVFCAILAGTGALVTFRPQIASALSPAPERTSNCEANVDWNKAEQEIEAYGKSKINRVYAPTAPDTRYRFRMMTDQDSIFDHVIYDACSAKVIGKANLGWMDWFVDFHHNLRYERTGRRTGGWVGLFLFLSALGGLALWFVSNPSFRKLFDIRGGAFLPRDLHISSGVFASALLLVATFTALCLCFPQTTRAALAMVTDVPTETRPQARPKPAAGTPVAGLGTIMKAAEKAIPGGVIREIRLPEGYGNVQVRMWLDGDFRSLGNNVATVDRASGDVVATDLYATKPASLRFIQAMAGLHYGEWGGLLYRTLYGVAGVVAALLFATGVLIWWLPKRRAAKRPVSVRVEAAASQAA